MNQNVNVATQLQDLSTPTHLRLVSDKELAAIQSPINKHTVTLLPNPRGLLLVEGNDSPARKALHERMRVRQEQRQMRKARHTSLVSIICIGLSLILFTSVSIGVIGIQHAQVDAVKSSVSVERIHVEEGESLWSIAEEHPMKGVSTQETVNYIKEINGLTNSSIITGQTLQVPAHTPENSVHNTIK